MSVDLNHSDNGAMYTYDLVQLLILQAYQSGWNDHSATISNIRQALPILLDTSNSPAISNNLYRLHIGIRSTDSYVSAVKDACSSALVSPQASTSNIPIAMRLVKSLDMSQAIIDIPDFSESLELSLSTVKGNKTLPRTSDSFEHVLNNGSHSPDLNNEQASLRRENSNPTGLTLLRSKDIHKKYLDDMYSPPTNKSSLKRS